MKLELKLMLSQAVDVEETILRNTLTAAQPC